MINTV